MRDPRDITDYTAPGSRVQSFAEGQTGLAGFFGLGELYHETRNLGAPAQKDPYPQKRPWPWRSPLTPRR